ncbi:hypothetical protein [Rhizobacter sp. Root1221]|uniref:hypothetical protein n=1 Tax=Rhizobacter sp. Root1221 TaxID=1736433 RepID=UPI0006FCD5F4|nr:hypothetical protein [Rhizobacter sp. Root1221]KQV99983.1 hypothetical protein ASC87_19985 [Rhizobacter sp. Root1221]
MRTNLLLAFAVGLLAGCNQQQYPAALPASAPAAVQQSGSMDPLAAGAIGAATGYMLGNATASRAPAIHTAPRTVIVNKTVINRPMYRAPTHSFSSGRRR